MPRGLVLCTLLWIILCGCKREPAANVFVDPALATLVPPDAVFVAGVRIQQLQATPIYQRYILTRRIPLIEQFARESGIDPLKDMWEVLVADDGTTTWVMLRGKFTEMGMEPRINREGVQRLGYKGYTMLGDERRAVLFLNPTTAAAASAKALRRIIDNRDKATGMPEWLRKKVETIPSTNQLWFAGKPDWRFGLSEQLVASVEAVSGGVDFRTGLNAHIAAAAKSEDDARKIADMLARGRFSNRIHVQNKHASVEVRVAIPDNLLDDFIRPVIGTGN
jgi:hypothetical protein